MKSIVAIHMVLIFDKGRQFLDLGQTKVRKRRVIEPTVAYRVANKVRGQYNRKPENHRRFPKSTTTIFGLKQDAPVQLSTEQKVKLVEAGLDESWNEPNSKLQPGPMIALVKCLVPTTLSMSYKVDRFALNGKSLTQMGTVNCARILRLFPSLIKAEAKVEYAEHQHSELVDEYR